jgi:hypothetical protein
VERVALTHACFVCSVVVILAGLAVFRNPISPLNAVASAVAVAGTWFYAQAETAAKANASKQA